MKKLFWSIVIIVIALTVVNEQTDFFENFGSYAPELEEKYPDAVKTVEDVSDCVSDWVGMIPSPSELYALITNKELPIDPSDVAVNAYIENSPMLSFYPKENISAKMKDGAYVRLFGVSDSDDRKHFIVRLTDENGEQLDQINMSADSSGEFDKTIKIPKTDSDRISIEVFSGSRAYGSFTSWVYNYLGIVKGSDGLWEIEKSPVYSHNKAMYTADRQISDALKDTPAIESDEEEIIELARKITANSETDYEKITAIHDWVCENIWYDTDKLNSTVTVPYSATKVLANKSAVCLGFSTLTAALCRSVNIPCNVVSGYALGVGSDTSWTDETIATKEQNHAWNEAYVDGRWVIMDTTWDCPNRIENGAKESGEISHLYFDANIDFFSANHKIIEYMKRP